MDILNTINSFVWGPPLLVLLVGTGIWLTLRLNLLQVLKLPMALKLIFSAKNDGDGDVNSFKALCTALAGFLLYRQPFDNHIWISLTIMLSAISVMSFLMYSETGVAFGIGDLLFFISAIWWGVFTV